MIDQLLKGITVRPLLHILALLLLLITWPLQAQFSLEPEHPAKAELLLDHQAIQPGESFYAIFKMTLNDKWHSYWLNPGDAGLPVEFNWTMPEGIKVNGPIQWPTPIEFNQAGDIKGYGYEKEMLLLIPMKASADLKIDQKLDLKLKADWLVCDDKTCLPGDAELKSSLLISKKSVKEHEDWVKKAKAQQPLNWHPHLKVTASQIIPMGQSSGPVSYTFKPAKAMKLKTIEFYPAPVEGFDLENLKVELREGQVYFQFKATLNELPNNQTTTIPSLEGILKLKDDQGREQSFKISLTITTFIS